MKIAFDPRLLFVEFPVIFLVLLLDYLCKLAFGTSSGPCNIPRRTHFYRTRVRSYSTHVSDWLTNNLVENWMSRPKYAHYADYADHADYADYAD